VLPGIKYTTVKLIGAGLARTRLLPIAFFGIVFILLAFAFSAQAASLTITNPGSGSGSSTNSFSMSDSDTTVTANFEIDTHAVTYRSGHFGNIQDSEGNLRTSRLWNTAATRCR
jgi:hypothetical protein